MGMYFIALLLLFIGMVISLFVKETWKMNICSVFLGISSVLLVLSSLFVLFTGNVLQKIIYIPPIFGEINFVIDPLSAFFILVISLMSLIGSIYGIGYLKPYLNKNMSINSHCLFFMSLIFSMLLVVTVQNALFFLVVWEIMSLSSFFLVIFENNKKEYPSKFRNKEHVRNLGVVTLKSEPSDGFDEEATECETRLDVINAGIKYMIYMHISVIFLISAFAILSIYSESLNFSNFAIILRENPKLADIVFLLAFIGFGTKAGFVPFHNWLPVAHPSAPSHISGIMSGIMIKTGIYGILRMLFITGINSKFIAYLVLSVSIISALWGVLYAISQHDIKKLLAYHSIENIGIIGIGIGIGLLGSLYNNQYMAVFGFSGAILHILNHSIFKELLFFSAGSVYTQTHTKDVELLGGLVKKMPYTSAFFIIGSIAICALPPFNGFISEFLIYSAMVLGLTVKNSALFMSIIISLASLALIGTMAVLCFTKVSGVMFLGNPRSENANNVQNDVSITMLFPMGLLAILTLIIGLFPQNAILIVLSPVSMFTPITFAFDKLYELTSALSIIFFIFLAIILAVYFIKKGLIRQNRLHTTWGCGYNKQNHRMQYTASSYADLFISTLKPLFKQIVHIKKPKEIFPKEAYYEAEIEDIEEAYIIKPLIKFDEEFLKKFEKIQNGNMQQYILWGLVFLILSILGLIWGVHL